MDLNELSNKDLWHIICELTNKSYYFRDGECEKLVGFLVAAYAEREGYKVTKDDLKWFIDEVGIGNSEVDFSDVFKRSLWKK